MSGREELLALAEAFTKRMSRACDRTQARKGGVLVDQIDWHGLMDLAEEARVLLRARAGTGDGA